MQNTSAFIQHVNAYEHKYVLHLCDMKCILNVQQTVWVHKASIEVGLCHLRGQTAD